MFQEQSGPTPSVSTGRVRSRDTITAAVKRWLIALCGPRTGHSQRSTTDLMAPLPRASRMHVSRDTTWTGPTRIKVLCAFPMEQSEFLRLREQPKQISRALVGARLRDGVAIAAACTGSCELREG